MLSVDQIDSLLNFSLKYFLLILSYLWYDLHVYHIRVNVGFDDSFSFHFWSDDSH